MSHSTSSQNPAPFNIIIVGCGRVGTELALSIARQSNYAVTIVDASQRAFDRLGANFRGRMVQGEAFDREVLMRAGIEHAYALAAVTSSDSANVVAAKIARDIFKVEHVVARVFNPSRASVYEKLGLQTITSSSWGARRIEQLLLHADIQCVLSTGNGEVQVYEINVPTRWNGRKLGDLIPSGVGLPVALVRGGRALLPASDAALQSQDLVHISATPQGLEELRRRLAQ